MSGYGLAADAPELRLEDNGLANDEAVRARLRTDRQPRANGEPDASFHVAGRRPDHDRPYSLARYASIRIHRRDRRILRRPRQLWSANARALRIERERLNRDLLIDDS